MADTLAPAGSAHIAQQVDLGRQAPAHARLLVAAIVLGIYSGHWGLMGVPVPLDRLAMAGAVALLVVWWARGRPLDWGFDPVHILMLLSVLGILVSASAAGTLGDPSSQFALLDRVVMPYLAFFLAPVALAGDRSRRLLVQALTATGAYVAITTIVSVTGPDWLLFPRYLADPSVGIAHDRGRGPSAESVGTGLLLVVCGAAAVINAVRTRGSARAASTATAALCTAAAFLTLTRSIWVSMVAVVIAVVVMFPEVRRRLPALVAALALVLGAALTLVPGLGSTALDRLGTERTLEDRAYTNEAAIGMVIHHPLTGVGWGRFVAESPDYIFQHDTGPLTNVDIEVHNVFLSRASELGVPAALLFAAIVLLGPVRAVVRRGDAPAAETGTDIRALGTVAVVAWLVLSMVTGLSFAFANLLVWALAGLALGVRGVPGACVEERS
jgi:O-antigen ligase